MGEFVKEYTIPVLTPSSADEIEIRIPPSLKRWSLIITLPDSGAGPASTAVEIHYEVQAGVFYKRNLDNTGGGGDAVALTNRANVITSEDVVAKVKLIFNNGLTVQSGGAIVRLYGAR